MKMPIYAIPFDLDTKAMEEDGLNDSERTAVYTKVKKVFKDNGMTNHLQYSMHATENTEDALKTVLKVVAALKTNAPEFRRYLSRCNLVRIEDDVDIADLLKSDDEQKAA